MITKRIVGAVAVLSLGASLPAMAGIAKVGPEFQVNTFTTSYQTNPSVASNTTGDFVVVWTSYGQDGYGSGIVGQRFSSAGTPLGVEFQVNTYTTGYQFSPSVAMNPSGSFVVVWTGPGDGSYNGIFGRLFDSAGTPLGNDFAINSYTTSSQNNPHVISDEGGQFVVVWQGYGQDGSAYGVFGRQFDSAGTPLGADFQVNTYTTGYQFQPSIGANGGGDFVVTWLSDKQDGSGSGIFAQRFDASASPVGAEFQVNTFTTGGQTSPSVDVSDSGGFVIAWTGYSAQDGSSSGIFGQRFDSGGAPLGGEFQVNTYTTGYQFSPAIQARGTGEFTVTWVSYYQDGLGSGVFAQRFDSAGAPLGQEFQVNTYTTSSQTRPAIALEPGGSFVVAWQSYFQDGSSTGVFAQRFQPTFSLNVPLAGASLDCHSPIFAGPTFKWDGAGYDVFRVLMSPVPGFLQGATVTSGTTLLKTTSYTVAVKKWQNACSKALAADPNNPILFIEVFGVDKNLKLKDPNRKKFTPAVQVIVTP